MEKKKINGFIKAFVATALFVAIIPAANAFAAYSPTAVWGSVGTAEGQFNFASDIATDASGNVYVADNMNHRVQKFDTNGNFLLMFGWGVKNGRHELQQCTNMCRSGIGGLSNGQFNDSYKIAVNTNGDILVADTTNHRIQIFSSRGTVIKTFGFGVYNGVNELQYCAGGDNCRSGIPTPDDADDINSGQFNQPMGIAIDSANNFYVMDKAANVIQKFDEFAFPQAIDRFLPGTRELQFFDPTGIAISQNRFIYIADSRNARIQKISLVGGHFEYTIGWGVSDHTVASYQKCVLGCWEGFPGSGDGQFKGLIGIDVDLNDNLFVADLYNDRIQKFNSNGEFVTKFGSSGTEVGQMRRPNAVASSSDGSVYVLDTLNNRVQRFEEQGENPPPPPPSPLPPPPPPPPGPPVDPPKPPEPPKKPAGFKCKPLKKKLAGYKKAKRWAHGLKRTKINKKMAKLRKEMKKKGCL